MGRSVSMLAVICGGLLAIAPATAAVRTLHLHLKIMTGDRGLHEDSELGAIVRLSDGTTRKFVLHDPHTPGWKPHTTVQKDLDLKDQQNGVSIIGIMLEFHQNTGDTPSHPWNMQGISVSDREGRVRKMVRDIRGPGDYDCVMRFTGAAGSATYFVPL